MVPERHHHVSFATIATRHSREIRVPRETFYDFVDKTIDRFAETSENQALFHSEQIVKISLTDITPQTRTTAILSRDFVARCRATLLCDKIAVCNCSYRLQEFS